MHDTLRFAVPKRASGRVLLIEDDLTLARSLERVIRSEGYETEHVTTGPEAIQRVMNGSYDVVVSDLNLPGASGVDILNVVRAYDADVPLVLMTGQPTVDTAIEAVSLGVLEYLVKPATRDQILRVINRAARVRKEALHRREAINASATAATERPPSHAPANENLRRTFDRALASLSVELDPIVRASARSTEVVGFSTRMISGEESLATEAALIVAAERVGRLGELRRRARDLAVKSFASASAGTTLFVDVFPEDLLDGDLYSADPPMARIADRIVLQVRASDALTIKDLAARASVLRFIGYRIAIVDLDAGQASLAQIAELAPEFVKIDGRLVKDMHQSAGRKRVVAALASMCRALDAQPIAEGVSSAEERDALVESGCYLVKGSLVARHAPVSQSRRNTPVPAVASVTSVTPGPKKTTSTMRSAYAPSLDEIVRLEAAFRKGA